MTTMSMDAYQPNATDALRMEFGQIAPRPFVALAAALIIAAYIVPFEYAWHRSTYDDAVDDGTAESAARQGVLQRQILVGALGLLGMATLAYSSQRLLRIRGPLGVICLAYVAWCATSCLWTDDLGISLRRTIALGCEIAAGAAIAHRASPRQFAWLVFICALSWLGLGILAELSLGTLQPWESGYRFHGLFHPNVMSAACAFVIMSSLYLSDWGRATKRLLLPIGGTALVFLVLTGSRTGLGALLLSLVVVSLIEASVPKRLFFAGAVGLAVVCTLFASGLGEFNISTDWAVMGRHDDEMATLTGRVPLWQELLNTYVRERPLEGHGYGAFWTPTHITDVADSQGWSPAYAHSTYVDLLLSIGVIGTILYLSAMVLAFVRASRLEVRYVKAGYGFIAMVIAYVLVDGALETTFGATSFTSFFGICAVCFLIFHADPDEALCGVERRTQRRRDVLSPDNVVGAERDGREGQTPAARNTQL